MHHTANDVTTLRNFISTLRCRLLNFSAEDNVRPLLQQQEALRKIYREQQERLEEARGEHARLLRLIKTQREASQNEWRSKELIELQKNTQKRLTILKKLDAPQVIIENEEKMLWERTTTIEELEVQLHLKKQSITKTQEDVRRTGIEIAAQQELYRLEKRKVQQALSAAEQQLKELCCLTEKSNGNTDNTFTSASPNPKSFRPKLSRRRRKQRVGLSYPEHVSVSTPLGSWRFFLTEDVQKQGTPLPTELPEFATEFAAMVDSKHTTIFPELVHEKLTLVTTMTLQQRSKLRCIRKSRLKKRRVGKSAPLGWKIVDCGVYSFRLFLDIHEAEQKIRFMITQRKPAYGGH